MRTLKFIVDKQVITQDPDCDFDDLVPGTEGFLQAEFSFSPEWDGCVKVATFHSVMGKEYTPQGLVSGKYCMIPAEALKKKKFMVGVAGKKRGYKLTTNKVTVTQDGGRV